MSKENAEIVFGKIQKTLDSMNYNYQVVEEYPYMVLASAPSKDLAINLIIYADEVRDAVVLKSILPCKFPEEKVMEGAIGISMINYSLAIGHFVIDLSDGVVHYVLSSFYTGNNIDIPLMDKLFSIARLVVDEYNDKLYDLARGVINIDQLREIMEQK